MSACACARRSEEPCGGFEGREVVDTERVRERERGEMARIGRLSSAVVCSLRSNVVVTSFEQAVDELVCNSVDAGATQVRVVFDGGGASVKVEDDGHGMSRDDLELVGLRHATSKLHALDELDAGVKTLGFRGEALSSLSDISILEITSKVQGCPHTYCKIMKGSTTVSLGLSSQQRARGTTVTMRDIFYNQPVRRRLFHSSSRKVLQSVKERIVRLALAHSGVSFILIDSLRVEGELRIRQHTSLCGTLQDVFGCELSQGLKEVDFAKGRLRVSGFLSSIPNYTSSKAIQYFYINHRFVHKTPLHKHLNRWGKSNAHICGAELSKRIEKVDTSLGRRAYPAFVLNLSCPLSEYDITFEATKTYVEFKDWTSVLTFLDKVLWESWGDETGERQAPQVSGKRKSWCTSDRANESSLEMKLRSKRARIQTVDDNIIAAPLQADSASVLQLDSNSLREDGIVDLGECAEGELAESYHSGDCLEIGTSCTSSWGNLAKPVLGIEKDGWPDPEISPPLFLGMDCPHSMPDCPSPDVLCLGSPFMKAISMPSSPILSEGSWGSRVNAYHRNDDFAFEVNSATDLNTDHGEFQLAFQCLGSGSSDILQGMPRPLRVREPWISPPITGRDSGSRITSLGGEMNGWVLPEISPPSINVLHSPSPTRSWSELETDGPQGASNEDDIAAESCSDADEAQFHCDHLKWSDRLEKPVYSLEEAGDYRVDVGQVLLPLGESPLDCTTNQLAELGMRQDGDGQKLISIEDVDIAIQGEQSGLQAERTCISLVEAPVPDMVLSKFRSTDEGNVHPDENLSQVASLYKAWSNPCMRANVNDILDVSAGILESCTKSLQPDMVTKESLQHARVLQQVDTKYIAIVTQNVLLLVDQHAADERVRLEEFRAQVLAAGKKQYSALLDAKHDLALGFGEQQTLHAYQKQIEDWGWRFEPAPDAPNLGRNAVWDSSTCNLQLTAVPCILGVNLTATDLEEYLQQLGATRGASVPPPAVIRLLNYKSCRGAIMFGDSLLPAECQQLVSHLKRTSLCFQCAHGRPTMVPLVNLQILRQHLETQDGVGNNTPRCQVQTDTRPCWHKLMQRPLSLLRARERLHHLEHT